MPEHTSRADSPLRVLLADDSAAFRSAAGAFLRGIDEVELLCEGSSGEEALARVQEERPDLVLMDVRMSGGNGLQAATRIKQLRDAPTVALFTLNADEPIRRAALATGADDFFPKSDFIQRVPVALHTAAARRDASERTMQRNTLTRGITHDINNIIMIITGNVSLARRTLQSGGEVDEYFEQIELASSHAARLVEQLITASNEPRLSDVQLVPLVHETVRLLRASLPEGIDIGTRFDAASLRVIADGSQLQRVIMNLCLNARHALCELDRPGDYPRRIEVRLQRCDLDAAAARKLAHELPAGRYVRLSVVDNGVGIDAATRARIFEPFFTTRGAGQGSGIGLSIAQAVVAAHRGVISVESEPGEGSAFHVFLPLAGDK
jgi:signal transduction histidine kinase